MSIQLLQQTGHAIELWRALLSGPREPAAEPFTARRPDTTRKEP